MKNTPKHGLTFFKPAISDKMQDGWLPPEKRQHDQFIGAGLFHDNLIFSADRI
ncbi:MAG: hypothetical protein R2791_16810 [Saprospiraceae bacterium]